MLNLLKKPKLTLHSCLKGLYHEDIDLFGQFYAKPLLGALLPIKKNSPEELWRWWNIFYYGASNSLFWWFWQEQHFNIFSSFNPCPSLPSFATVDSKQFQCLSVVLNDKTGISIFRFQLMQRDVLAFWNKLRDIPPLIEGIKQLEITYDGGKVATAA